MARLLIALFFLLPVTAFAADPMDARTAAQYYAAGHAHQQKGNFLQARLLSERAEVFAPDNADLHNDMGLVFEALGQADEAQKHYMKAIELDHKCLPAYSNLGYFYKTRGDLKMAAVYFEQRVAFGDPRDPWTLQAQAELESIIGTSPELVRKKLLREQRSLENATALHQQEAALAEHRERIVSAAMEQQHVLDLFDQGRLVVVRRDGDAQDRGLVLEALAYLYKARGDSAKAAAYFEQRIALGNAHDPWMLKAQAELDEIRRSSPELMQEKIRIDQKLLENAMVLRSKEAQRAAQETSLDLYDKDLLIKSLGGPVEIPSAGQ
jgi:tetratricopeptide (TPR) repeat protein